MRVSIVLSGFLLALTTGCSVLGYDPEDPVTIQVAAPADLNTYEGSAQSLDLYFFRVDEPQSFAGAEPAALRTQNQAVPGGQALGRWTVSPGEQRPVDVGPMRYGRWTHIGVYAAYGDPATSPGALTRVAEIPASGKLAIVLGAQEIYTFDEADD